MPANYRPVSYWLDQRRQQAENANQLTGGPMKVSGFIEVSGTGETLYQVNFPVNFVERPASSFGGELTEGQDVQSGAFPTISCVVANWNFGTKSDTGARYYQGATLAIVSSGTTGQIMIVHYQFEGKALINPWTPPADTGSTV